MKYCEIIKDYLLDWQEIDSFIQQSAPIILKENSTSRMTWYETYYQPKKTPIKQFFLGYGNTILMSLRWQEINPTKVELKEVRVANQIKLERKECLSLLQVALVLENYQRMVIQLSELDTSWQYNFKQQEALVTENSLEIQHSFKAGLVLSGGGAKGSYQIGVWQALEEQNCHFDVITGTSVGALNGAFVMQNDFEKAKKMWEEIATSKILDFPMNNESDDKLTNQLIEELPSFLKTAVMNKGVSTEPLQKMIESYLSIDSIKQNPAAFYICTTRVKNMNEQVIDVKKQNNEQAHQWLLASSSFFPAMAATKIEEDYYVDGGYRNNIPVDVAIEHGATELVVVDIEGPGVIKNATIPLTIPTKYLKSHWSLGTVLLFDQERAKWNILLGYLEGKKMLGELSGNYYSFVYKEDSLPIRTMNYRLLKRVFTDEQIKLISNEDMDAFVKKIRKLSIDRVSIHTGLFNCMELLAKRLGVSPTHVYTFESFIDEIVSCFNQAQSETETMEMNMLHSIGEYIASYFGKTPLISERAQVLLLTDFLLKDKISNESLRRLALLNTPVLVMAKMLASFIKERGNENGSRI